MLQHPFESPPFYELFTSRQETNRTQQGEALTLARMSWSVVVVGSSSSRLPEAVNPNHRLWPVFQ